MLVYRCVNVEGEAINYFLKIMRFITKLFISCRNMFDLSQQENHQQNMFSAHPFSKGKHQQLKSLLHSVFHVFLTEPNCVIGRKDVTPILSCFNFYFFSKREIWSSIIIHHPCGKFHHPSSSQSSMIFHNVKMFIIHHLVCVRTPTPEKKVPQT